MSQIPLKGPLRLLQATGNGKKEALDSGIHTFGNFAGNHIGSYELSRCVAHASKRQLIAAGVAVSDNSPDIGLDHMPNFKC